MSKTWSKRENYDVNKFFVGAALNTNQLNTYVENIFLNEFNYSTVENGAKAINSSS